MLRATFDPALLDLGAILPRFEGQQPNQALLKLINTADVDMEVGKCNGGLHVRMTST